MAVKHIVFDEKTGKGELKTFKSEKDYKAFKARPEQTAWRVRVDLKVEAESANKKLRQLEKKGMTSSPAYKQAIHQIHLLTGDKTATRFPTSGKNHVENQKAVQAARKFNRYETATPGGYERVQRRARREFNKKFELGAKLSESQYDMITTVKDTLVEMYDALVPQSSEMFDSLIDIGNEQQFDETDIEDFAKELNEAIKEAPDIISEYTRHLISRGLDMFAHGQTPDIQEMIDDVLNRERKRLEQAKAKLKSKKFPYK